MHLSANRFIDADEMRGSQTSIGGCGVNYDSQIIHDELEVTELHQMFLLCPCVE